MINNRKGISTIIATVLIVLITVAAVTILWAAVSPLIDQSADLGCFEVANALTVDSNAEFSKVLTNDLNIRIERGANSDALQGFDLIVDVDGNSVSDAVLTFDSAGLPTQNGASVIVFDHSGADSGNATALDFGSDLGLTATSSVSVAVAPVIQIEGENTACDASAFVEITNKIP